MLLLVGLAGVGKSSLMQRLQHDTFNVPSHRVAKLEQSAKFEFAPAPAWSNTLAAKLSSLTSHKPGAVLAKSTPAANSDAISEAEEDENTSGSEGSSSSSIADTSSSSSMRSSSPAPGAGQPASVITALARIDFLENTATLKAALLQGTSKKYVIYVVDICAPESLAKLNEFAPVVASIDPPPTTVLVACKCDEQGFSTPHSGRSSRRHSRHFTDLNEHFVEVAEAVAVLTPYGTGELSPLRRHSSDSLDSPLRSHSLTDLGSSTGAPRIPDCDVESFVRQYHVSASFKVSNQSGKGIAELKEQLQRFLV